MSGSEANEKLPYTAKLSDINPDYYIILLHGKGHRVCHRSALAERYPNIKIED